MSSPPIDFYFDYLSGYAYFAWFKVLRLCQERKLDLRIQPVLFAGLLNHWGQLGPAEIPPKKEFVYKVGCRYGALHGIPFNPPKYHPFNPLHALRVSLREVSGDQQARVVDAIWKAGWASGRDIGDPKELEDILEKAGIDGSSLMQKTRSPEIKEILRLGTEQAIQKGVFGIPTVIVRQELFWGDDQFEYIGLYLDGKDPLDRERLREMLARPRAVDCRR